MALCPTTWLKNTDGSVIPDTTPYISLYSAWFANECFDTVGPSLNWSGLLDLDGGTKKNPTPADMASSVDLCYFYRQEAINNSQPVNLQAVNQ